MKTGSTYTGEVNSNNERHGWGLYQGFIAFLLSIFTESLLFYLLVIYGGYYEGFWKNGFKTGKGTFYYKGGGKHYEGDWSCGEPHGKIYSFN